MLYYLHTSKNLGYPYWSYNEFDLENWTDAECRSELRFLKGDLYRLFEVFDIPEKITCYNRSKFSGLEGFCLFLKRFAYSCRYSDLVPRFGGPVPEVCIMSNYVMNMLHENFYHLLHSFYQPLLSQQNLELSTHAVHDKGAAPRNCWGFVDGTVRPICRPNERIQRILYS